MRAGTPHLLPVFTALLVDVLVFSTSLGGREPATAAGRLAIISYAAPAAAALLLRHRAPVAVFGVLAGHSVLARLLLPESHPTACLLVGLAAVAQHRPPRVALPALAMALGISALVVQEAVTTEPNAAMRTGTLLATASAYLLIDGVAFATGWWAGRNRRRLEEMEQRGRADLEAQRTRAAEALTAERTRIARELHDIVAHSVTVMVLHAAGARGVLESAPDLAARSLRTVEDVGGQAMDELRRLLGVLRDSGAPGSVMDDPTLAGLAQLDELVDPVARSGVVVQLVRTGTPATLDPSVDLAAYRLIQEGLTNVSKHAGPGTTCVIALAWGSDRLIVSVRDDGAGTVATHAAEISTGHGLLGLRERIAIAGGALRAGRDSKGYLVEAWLPLRRPVTAEGSHLAVRTDEG